MSKSRKDRNVSVDLFPEQKAAVRELAVKSGLSQADWLRAVVACAIKRSATFSITYTEQSHETR